MIAAAITLILAAQPTWIIRIELRQSGDVCTMRIGKDSADPRDEKAVAALLSRYDPKRYVIEIIADENLTYRCIGGIVYRIQGQGFTFAKVGILSQPPVQ
ncbi:hypothetical protein ACFSC3_11270 [Sphingomonas floccifaciens]|uniref:Uncharacterized protein n=1 Tax=Sphingomonas floccifaciens TaxID=1844115 RepID=A0ABW4NEI4_9SPHN